MRYEIIRIKERIVPARTVTMRLTGMGGTDLGTGPVFDEPDRIFKIGERGCVNNKKELKQLLASGEWALV